MNKHRAQNKRVTKRDLASDLYHKGFNVEAIATLLGTQATYVANALLDQGVIPNYMDLYTSTSKGPHNAPAALLAGVLRFREPADAQASVVALNQHFQQFCAARDRRGMHQCQVLALVGMHRAAGLGKHRQAQAFATWLMGSLSQAC